MNKKANLKLKDLELKDGEDTQPLAGFGLAGTTLDESRTGSRLAYDGQLTPSQ